MCSATIAYVTDREECENRKQNTNDSIEPLIQEGRVAEVRVKYGRLGITGRKRKIPTADDTTFIQKVNADTQNANNVFMATEEVRVSDRNHFLKNVFQ